MKKYFLILLLFILVDSLSKVSAIESSPQFIQGTDTLVVYKDVPGLAPSDKYTIRVKSAATNNEWVDVFVNVTNNRAVPGSTDLNSPDKYQVNCAGWSHAYGNIEMNTGQTVEVEIAAKPGFKIGGKDFEKAKVHPAQKASAATLLGGKIYFTITKPGQIYIDINGQMDDYNRAINPIGHPVHAVSLWANPVIKKPSLTGTRVKTIEPGTNLATINAIDPATYDTLSFKPGVHDLAMGIKMHPGKTIYLPGDAYLFGAFNNHGVPNGSFSRNGENITIYGYGTICGVKIPHFQIAPDVLATLYPGVVIDINSEKPIMIDNGFKYKVFGITLADAANHSIELNGEQGSLKWVKTITWRVNGDGLGGYTPAEDCFIRSHDDCSYLKANKKRCTFWKDSNARLIFFGGAPENTINPIIIEDCDILYARLRTNPGTNGGGFTSGGTEGQRKVNAILRDIRIHDKLINMPIVNFNSSNGSSYQGILFQNISIAGMAPGNKQKLLGSALSPYNGGLIFDNLTIGGTLVTNENYKTYFDTNEFVKDIWFRMPEYFTVTKNVNAAQGSVTVSPTQATYIENSIATLTATALPGYEFAGWSGDTIATSNPLLLKMNGNKTVTANFNAVGAKTLTVTPAINGTIAVNPTGESQTTNSTVTLTAKPAIGYKFDSWAGDVTGTNIITTLKMDADKTISANFVKTNNFAINCGGDQYIAADGTVYAQTPTGTFNTTATIANTNDQFLYKSEKGGKTFSYDLPVDNGNYTVTLKFAEIFWQAAGKRVFSVSIEGTPVLTSFDIFAEAGGRYKALDKIFNTTITDGVLNIAFATTLDNAKISAIKISNNAETTITTLELNNSISIYPNPAIDKLYFNSADKPISKIQLVDLTGKIIYSVKVKLQNGSIDLKGIDKGLYIVKLHVDNFIFTKKIRVK